MRVHGLLVAAIATGCGFDHGAALRDGSVTQDGATDGAIIDAPPDAFDPLCFGRAPFTICLPSMPSGSISLDAIDTDGTTTCSNGGVVMMVGSTPAAACVIAADSIDLASTIVGVSGDKPAVLLAVSTLRINAGSTLDVTSGQTGDGPGANPEADCGASVTAANGNDHVGGGGGGAGGSFGALGGAGAPGAGGTGGTPDAIAMTPVSKLRGGCRGGSGGDGDGANSGGSRVPGGSGGGAIYLLSRGELILDGTVNASGAGGAGGQASKGGGGGGGSGGMILVHTATFSIGPNGKLFANGGGGGAGAGNGQTGNRGADALVINMAAAGGPSAGGGTSTGGDGGYKSTAAKSATNNGNGGAGGGGGVGVIRVLSGQPIPANNVSPTPQLN